MENGSKGRRKASVKDVRRANRALLLRHLLLARETNRSEASEATGLSPTSVTNMVNELVAEGVVVEGGQLDSSGGRPRTIVTVNPDAAYVIGADVGEAEVVTEMFDLTMKRVASRSQGFEERRISPEEVTRVIADSVAELLRDAEETRGPEVARRVLGVGLGVPGIVERPENLAGRGDPTLEPIVHAQVVGWDETDFATLAERLDLPLMIDNGAKTTTQAEAWFGAAKGVDHAIVVLIGDGVGAGIITNGRLFRGSSSSAGEWGHTKISLDGPSCRCGGRGCIESFIGASAVVAAWRGPDPSRAGHEMDDVEALLAAYRAGEARARKAMDGLVANLGVALSNLVNLYNPARIVLAGWFGDKIAEELLPDVRRSMVASSLPQPGREVALVRSRLGRNAVAMGAATLPLDRFIEHGWPSLPWSTEGRGEVPGKGDGGLVSRG
jgi:predicted NBD/HSP70 family sugar kinase